MLAGYVYFLGLTYLAQVEVCSLMSIATVLFLCRRREAAKNADEDVCVAASGSPVSVRLLFLLTGSRAAALQ